MSLVYLEGDGIRWPRLISLLSPSGSSGGYSSASLLGSIDAAAEKIAMMGYVHWEGAPTSAKTMDSTSKIHWRTGASVFSDPASRISIGLQDLSTSAGPPCRPDGTFDVYRELIGGTDALSPNSAISTALSTSGSKSVAHGDLVAVVFDMTARGGADGVAVINLGMSSTGSDRLGFPTASSQIAGTWTVNTFTAMPHVLLEASDGTSGILAGSFYIASGNVYTFNSGSTPDEYGLIFQVPFRCKVDGATITIGATSATADYNVKLYSSPLTAPTTLATKSILGEHFPNYTDERPTIIMFGTEQILEPNVDYCIAIEATGAGSLDFGYIGIAAVHRAVNGLANCRRGSRTNGTGAFSETTTEIPAIQVNICAIDDGNGLGRASLNLGI